MKLPSRSIAMCTLTTLLLFSAASPGSSQTSSQPRQPEQSGQSGTATASVQSNPAKPDPLLLLNGSRVITPHQFLRERRPQILHLFEERVFGHTPTEQLPQQRKVTSVDPHALGGLAIRKQITITVHSRPGAPISASHEIHLLLYLPANRSSKTPIFLGLNFFGNHTINADPGIDLHDVWLAEPTSTSDTNSSPAQQRTYRRIYPPASSRGSNANQWPVTDILKAGYGLATIYAGDLEPDFIGAIDDGIRPLFFQRGHTTPQPNEWGALGAWAWGLSRAVDYLVTDPAIDAKRIIAIGHSRMGKAALWAAAQDLRFALVISNESGKGGASLLRHPDGETIAHLNVAFPYWFSPNYHHFTDHLDQLPIDGHLLLALIAPRPLFVASADSDPWSDPHGEFLATLAASPVYQLFSQEALSPQDRYQVGQLAGGQLTYYSRPGGHDILNEDWKRYIAFADRYLAFESNE